MNTKQRKLDKLLSEVSFKLSIEVLSPGMDVVSTAILVTTIRMVLISIFLSFGGWPGNC